MGPDAGISGVVVFIVLVTNRVVVRDLEVLVPPNSMVFRHASFWTMSQEALLPKIIVFLGQTWVWS